MAVFSFANKTYSRSMLNGNAAYDPAAMIAIASFTATGGETSYTFSSIPQTYSSLQIWFSSRDSYSGTLLAMYGVINGDATTNYTYHRLEGTGSSASADGSITESNMWIPWSAGALQTSGITGVGIIDIHDYALTTNYKTARAFTGCDANGSGRVQMLSYLWKSTSAITSLKFSPLGTFSAGTTIHLFGIKG